ncbi:MAG: right-handed parallel beta-helix repeat-containing protein, partial [Clostridia bacterium]|nr:right-handed parallel beta-helix repeat-containing protein [Clostridia bacterium]
LGTVFLTEGTYSLKIKDEGPSAMRLRGIRITIAPPAAEDIAETFFLPEAREAQSAQEIREIFKKYNDMLLIPYDDYLNELFYTKLIDRELAKLPFNTLEETDALFLTLYNSEKANPLVSVMQNDASVTTLENGAFTVDVAPRFMERLKAVAAIYTDDGNRLIDAEVLDIVPYEGATFTGLSATDEGKLLKVFFIKDTQTLRPQELPLIQSAIYVATDGSDADDGTLDKPLQTITKAIEKASELNAIHQRDTVIWLAGGEYVIDSTIELDEGMSARADCGIHFKSLTPENPAVISGGYDVPRWESTGENGIYKAQLPEDITDVRQLYINEYPAQRARSDKYFFADNRWDNEANNTDANGKDTGYTEDGFEVYNSEFPVLAKPQDAEIAYPIKWTVQRLPVEDIVYEAGNKTIVKMQQPYYSTGITMICGGGVQPTIGNKFYIENDLTLLDECGEFYFDKDTHIIYYKPFDEENLATDRTVIAKTENLLSIRGSSAENKVKNISFSDISFRYGGYYTEINEEGAVSFQAENLVDADSGLKQNTVSTGVGRTLDAQIVVENAESILFRNCDIACMGSTALRMGTGVTDSFVKGCTFSDIGGGALSISTWEGEKALAERVQIENNVISRVGLDFMFCPAISIYYAKDVDVLHNTIAHTPYSGISVNWGWAYKFGVTEVTVTDENGEPVLDESGKPVTEEVLNDNPSKANKLGVGGHNISYNRIYDISNSVVDGGHIYNVGYMTDCTITNNYLTDSPDHGGVYLDTGASNVKIRNNVFERCQRFNIAYGGSKLVLGNIAEENWADKAESKTWPGSGCSFEDIIVVDAENLPEAAQRVVDGAGVTEAYTANLAKLTKPAFRTLEHFDYPDEEALEPGVIYVNAGDYQKYYIKPADWENKKEPALYYFSGIPAIGDFRWREWSQYEVVIPETGTYNLSLNYSKPKETTKVYIYLGTEELDAKYDYANDYLKSNATLAAPEALFANYTLGATNTATTGYVPHIFNDPATGQPKNLELTKGTYYLRMLNNGNGFGFSRFRFIPVSDDK